MDVTYRREYTCMAIYSVLGMMDRIKRPTVYPVSFHRG